MKYIRIISFLCTLILLLGSCKDTPPNQEMIDLLQSIDKSENNPENTFYPEAILRFNDSLLNSPMADDVMKIKYRKANALLQLGQEQKAIDVFQEMLTQTPASEIRQRIFIMKDLAMAYLRLGERTNCVHNHSAESCIFLFQWREYTRTKLVRKKRLNYTKNC